MVFRDRTVEMTRSSGQNVLFKNSIMGMVCLGLAIVTWTQ